jgi:hypothetical protein
VARGEPLRETIPSDYYRRDPFDARTYPAPRSKRAGPPAVTVPGAAAGAPQPTSYPRSRVLWFESSTVGNTRSSAASQRLYGPTIITSVFWMQSGALDPGNRWLELGKAFSPINEINVGITSTKAYTPLVEGPSTPQTVVPTGFNGWWLSTPDSNIPNGEFTCRIVVPDRDWFLIFAVGNNTVNTISVRGGCSVLDQVDPFALAAYVG